MESLYNALVNEDLNLNIPQGVPNSMPDPRVPMSNWTPEMRQNRDLLIQQMNSAGNSGLLSLANDIGSQQPSMSDLREQLYRPAWDKAARQELTPAGTMGDQIVPQYGSRNLNFYQDNAAPTQAMLDRYKLPAQQTAPADMTIGQVNQNRNLLSDLGFDPAALTKNRQLMMEAENARIAKANEAEADRQAKLNESQNELAGKKYVADQGVRSAQIQADTTDKWRQSQIESENSYRTEVARLNAEGKLDAAIVASLANNPTFSTQPPEKQAQMVANIKQALMNGAGQGNTAPSPSSPTPTNSPAPAPTPAMGKQLHPQLKTWLDAQTAKGLKAQALEQIKTQYPDQYEAALQI